MGTRNLCLAFALLPLFAGGQWAESFSDGNLSAAPAWSGDASSYIVSPGSDAGPGAEGSSTLRLAAASGSGLKALVTQVPGPWGNGQAWGFFLGRRGQAATASNVSYVWLYMVEGTVTGASGYRVRFGDDSGGDEVVLECVQSGVAKAIISSSGSVSNGLTDYGFHVRVTREESGAWSLFTSPLPAAVGAGTPAGTEGPAATVLQGRGTDATFTILDNGYMGLAATHTSTTAARSGLELDDLYLETVPGRPLPVRFRSFTAVRKGAELHLAAEVAEADGPVLFSVQRSRDGRHFADWQAPLRRLREDGMALEATDRERHAGTVYYRLRAEEEGGSTYSSIIMVAEGPVPGALYVWPNPVLPGGRTILISGVRGTGTLVLYNFGGWPVASLRVGEAAGTATWTLPPLAAGLYLLRWTGTPSGSTRLTVF